MLGESKSRLTIHRVDFDDEISFVKIVVTSLLARPPLVKSTDSASDANQSAEPVPNFKKFRKVLLSKEH